MAKSSSNPDKYKYEYGGRSYQSKSDARAASKKDNGASASNKKKSSGGGGGSSKKTQTPYDKAIALGYKGTPAPAGESVAQTYNRGVDVVNSDPGGIRGQTDALKKAGSPGGPEADNRVFNPLPAPYEGTGNADLPAWATGPSASGQGADQGQGQFSAPTTSHADDAYQSLISALQTTGAERNVQGEQDDEERKLRNLNRGQEQTNRNIKDQPIAKPFITGQQAAVAEQYGIDRGASNDRLQTLQQKLAGLQAQRQSSIDVAQAGIQYGQNQDNRADQAYQNQIAQQQYQQQQAQQQYQNTTDQSRYVDSQNQQAIDNQYRQNQANKPSTARTQEEKETEAFDDEASVLVQQLGADKISWATAWNTLKAGYPNASNDLIDQTLNKSTYQNYTGSKADGRSI